MKNIVLILCMCTKTLEGHLPNVLHLITATLSNRKKLIMLHVYLLMSMYDAKAHPA